MQLPSVWDSAVREASAMLEPPLETKCDRGVRALISNGRTGYEWKSSDV